MTAAKTAQPSPAATPRQPAGARSSAHLNQLINRTQKSKRTYILLGALLGFGIHNFYAGRMIRGFAQLLLCTVSLLGMFFVAETPAAMLIFRSIGGIYTIWAIIDFCTVKTDGDGIPFRPLRASNQSQDATMVPFPAILARCLPGLIVASELLFLFLCALLPLVAKAAWGGSGSPGAGPQPTRGVNIAFFIAIWLLTAATTGLAAYAAKCQADTLPPDAPPARFPRPVAILAALLLLIVVAFSAGLLQL